MTAPLNTSRTAPYKLAGLVLTLITIAAIVLVYFQFRGGAGADGGGQGLPRHHRGGDAHVDQRGEEAGERLHTDIAQRRETLNRDE